MDIRIIILGALKKQAGSGYQIRRRIEVDFGHFRSISTGGLYAGIAKLLAHGLIEELDPPAGSLERRRFAITDAGRAELRRVVRGIGTAEKLQSDFLAAIYFSDPEDGNLVTRLIDEKVGSLNREQRELLALPLAGMSDAERFTVRYSLALRRAALEFLTHEGRAIARAIELQVHDK